MKNALVLMSLFLLVTGCAKHVRSELVTGPNGRQAIAMRCGNMPACYKEAGGARCRPSASGCQWHKPSLRRA